jgi:hypothetical protein
MIGSMDIRAITAHNASAVTPSVHDADRFVLRVMSLSVEKGLEKGEPAAPT